MAPALRSPASVASFCLVSLALTPLALRAQSQPREPVTAVIVQSPPVVMPTQTVIVVQPVVVAQQQAQDTVQIRWSTSWYPATRVRPLWGPYALYRFVGYGAEWDSIVHERDVRPVGAPTPAWQAPTPGLEMPIEHRISRGESLMGEWHGSWFPIRVLALRANGGARIRYDGYGREWDEDMVRGRLRLRDPDVDGPAPAVPTAEHLRNADPQQPPAVGERVVVRHGPTPKVARITAVDGPVFWVHYLGHNRSYDEPVSLDRVQHIDQGNASTR
jgi:hypothetical protein